MTSKSFLKLLPVDEHRDEIVSQIVAAGRKWLERNSKRLNEEYTQIISEIIATENIENGAFNSVAQLQLLQHVYVADLVNSVHGGDVARANEMISRIVGALEIQTALDIYDYQQMLLELPATDIAYGNDVNFALIQACTALWVNDLDCVRNLYYSFLEYRKHGHLDGFNGDSCFLEFTIWMLGQVILGDCEISDLSVFGPYRALVEKFSADDLLVDELIVVADYHLYRSADFPGAEPFPSFYGEVIGAYPAEILAYIAIRRRMVDHECKALHVLIPQEWFALEQEINATYPPFAKEIKKRFALAFP